FKQDVQEKPHNDGKKNKSSSIHERTTQPLVKPQQSFIPFPNQGCEVFVRREAQDKLEAISEKCLFVGFLEESFGYLFYKTKDNVVCVARRGVFLEREMISKEDSESKIDLEEIQESTNEEPIVNTDTQQEVKRWRN
nr:retrotransposon protein, putative, Ty1-copia subclass [Tanacetum cinerariifolium]